MITAVIVDDEQQSIVALNTILNDYFKNEVKILASFRSVEDGVAGIKKLSPNLVFLDIQLGNNRTSFELLDALKPIDFEIVFVTAHDKYAIQAFNFYACHYLLKPFAIDKIEEAVKRVRERISNIPLGINQKLETLLEHMKYKHSKEYITIANNEGQHVLKISNVVKCESNKRTGVEFLYLNGHKKENIVSFVKTLEEVAKMLEGSNVFFQVNRSCLINLTHVKKYLSNRDVEFINPDIENVNVSESRRAKLKEKLGDLP